MKILVLANKMPYPPRDGGSIATLNLLKGLSQLGHQVSCLAINTSKHYFPPEKIPEKLQRAIRFLSVDCNTRISPVHLVLNFLFSRKAYIAQRFKKRAYRKALIHLLQKEEFQIIQMEGPYLVHYLSDLRTYSQARIMLRAHNLEFQIWGSKSRQEKHILKKLYFRSLAKRLKRLEIKVANESDGLVPISDSDEQSFQALGIRVPVKSIPAGLPLDDYPFQKLPEELSLFFIGALDWLPNQEGLLWFLDHVFEDICREEPALLLHVAGRNAPAGFEKKMRHERIIYHGEVADARAFMQEHAIMIAPLLTGSGIRIKILEAMALGRPVITTPVGIEGIPAIKNKHVCIETQAEAFRKQVLYRLRHPESLGSMCLSARELLRRNFDTFKLSERLSSFYEEQL